MHFRIAKAWLTRNLRDALRNCGYFGIQDRQSGRVSYVRRLSKSQHYPRFHLYLEELSQGYNFSLHLDQKKESYQGTRAHSADYDEPEVKAEASRIKESIKY